MIDMVLKNKSGISHAQDLQVVIVVSGVKGYQNDVTTTVWDKVYELQNGTLEFQAPEKMTKELIIQDAVHDNNPIIQKHHQNDFNFLKNRFESGFFCFSVVNNELIVKQYGIYEIHFRDGYKEGAADVLLKLAPKLPKKS